MFAIDNDSPSRIELAYSYISWFARGLRSTHMPVICLNLTALAIAILYVGWRDHQRHQSQRTKVMRERVAYMLWTAANVGA
jgi:hypothetical protein